MRHLVSGLFILMNCSAAGAAGITVNPEALRTGHDQPGGLSALPALNMEFPVPAEVSDGLPEFRANENGDFDLEPGAQPALPELPGLSSLPNPDSEIELPGLDGLPIRVTVPANREVPPIPGFDGLPLGYGRR